MRETIFFSPPDASGEFVIISHPSGNHELQPTIAAFLACPTHHVVSLLTDPEITQLGLQEQLILVAVGNADVHHFPILDRSIVNVPHAF